MSFRTHFFCNHDQKTNSGRQTPMLAEAKKLSIFVVRFLVLTTNLETKFQQETEIKNEKIKRI